MHILGASLADVHLELAQEEEEEVKWGRVLMHEMSPVHFLQTKFTLEEEQCVDLWPYFDVYWWPFLHYLDESFARCLHKQGQRKAELLEKCNALYCRIIKWREVQIVYMPGAEQIIARAKSTTSTEQLNHAKLKNLFFPLSISLTNCASSFVSLCQSSSSNMANTQPVRDWVEQLDRFCDKTRQCAQCYSTAFAALSVLDPRGNWTQHLQKLNHSKDLQLPQCEEEDPKKKNGQLVEENRRELSWIWLMPKMGSRQSDTMTADEINDYEYCHLLITV